MPPIPHELAMGNKIDTTVAGAVIYSCGGFYTSTLALETSLRMRRNKGYKTRV